MSDDLENPAAESARPRFMRTGEFAIKLVGSDSRAAKARVSRMADRGDLAVVRIGPRGDRLFPATELDRLRAEAERSRRTTDPPDRVRKKVMASVPADATTSDSLKEARTCCEQSSKTSRPDHDPSDIDTAVSLGNGHRFDIADSVAERPQGRGQ